MTDKFSRKDIPVDERLIFALDFPSVNDALDLVDRLGNSVKFFKVGLELFMTGEYFSLVESLQKREKKIFIDLKFFDVPETVRSAVRQLQDKHATFITVHGNDNILKAAAEEKGHLKILAVTALTSLGQGDIEDLGFKCDIKQLVLSRTKRAIAVGCDGVISSGLEAPVLRQELGDCFLIVSPGIRPVANVDDQKRVVSVEQAFLNGADYIVVGRPIKLAKDPVVEAEKIQSQIAALFKENK